MADMTGGLPALTLALAHAGTGVHRKLSAAQMENRAKRVAYADEHGISHDTRQWTPGQLDYARNQHWFTGQQPQPHLLPETVASEHEAGQALASMLVSARSSVGMKPSSRGASQQAQVQAATMQAARLLGLA